MNRGINRIKRLSLVVIALLIAWGGWMGESAAGAAPFKSPLPGVEHGQPHVKPPKSKQPKPVRIVKQRRPSTSPGSARHTR